MRKSDWIVKTYSNIKDLQKHLNQWEHDYEIDLVYCQFVISDQNEFYIFAVIKRTKKKEA